MKTLGVAAAIGVVAHSITKWRVERDSLRRLPVGADGKIPGAEGLTISAGPRAALLLHGFGDTPQTLHDLARALAASGWSVSVPLIPGHGRTVREFGRSRGSQWLDAGRGALRALQKEHTSIALVGLSMGGALAAQLAAEERAVSSLVLLAPYLSMPTGIRRLSRMHPLWSLVAPYVAGRSQRSIHDPVARKASLGYGVSTPRLLFELSRIASAGMEALARVTVPTLLIQSVEDNRVPPAAARRAFDRIAAAEKELIWLAASGHVITVDYERERVTTLACEWISRHQALSDATRVAP